MSGHSKWATTKRQKAVVDAKRGAAFTKLGNMIAIAARGGADPAINPSLAMAIEKAKAANMPAVNIQRAIDRVADKSAAALEEIAYEAYGPGGVGLLIECATDNRNRTLPEVRTALTKHGGRIADEGSVAFQFSRVGVLRLELADQSANFTNTDDLLLQILECGADDADENNGEIVAYTDMKKLHEIREKLVTAGLKIADAGLEYVANTAGKIAGETTEKFERLYDALIYLDDVQNIFTNADVKD